jgi:hypothetical protein
MKYSNEDIINSLNRIQLSLKKDEDIMKQNDEWLLDIPLIDEYIRLYNKARKRQESNDRVIMCKLCNVKFSLKNKASHVRTIKHQNKVSGDISIFDNVENV